MFNLWLDVGCAGSAPKRNARKRNEFTRKVTSKQKTLFISFSTLRDRLALNFAQALPRHVLCGHAPAGLPETYVIHQLVHMRLKALLALLRAPNFYAMLHKPFNNKLRSILATPKPPSNFFRVGTLICAQSLNTALPARTPRRVSKLTVCTKSYRDLSRAATHHLCRLGLSSTLYINNKLFSRYFCLSRMLCSQKNVIVLQDYIVKFSRCYYSLYYIFTKITT